MGTEGGLTFSGSRGAVFSIQEPFYLKKPVSSTESKT